MPLFSRKSEADAAEFTTSFYDQYVFGPDPAGDDLAQTFGEVVRDPISEDVPSFAAVSLPKLTEELRAARLEMIGTAWTHESTVEAALVVSETTKAYLSSLGRLDLWEAMLAYNNAVAESITYGADPKSRTGRAWLVMVNKGRLDFSKKWHEGRDLEAVGRVANRILGERAWKRGFTQGAVGLLVPHRLDIEGSDPIWEQLALVAHGFYQGAKEELEGVRLVQ